MSMMTRADLLGETVMGVLVVWIVTLGPGAVSDGEEGWVRSKPVCEEWSQKFDEEPMRALRCGFVGSVEDMLANAQS
jgi:hypothetical protein